jgi:hypothetical protein
VTHVLSLPVTDSYKKESGYLVVVHVQEPLIVGKTPHKCILLQLPSVTEVVAVPYLRAPLMDKLRSSTCPSPVTGASEIAVPLPGMGMSASWGGSLMGCFHATLAKVRVPDKGIFASSTGTAAIKVRFR